MHPTPSSIIAGHRTAYHRRRQERPRGRTATGGSPPAIPTRPRPRRPVEAKATNLPTEPAFSKPREHAQQLGLVCAYGIGWNSFVSWTKSTTLRLPTSLLESHRAMSDSLDETGQLKHAITCNDVSRVEELLTSNAALRARVPGHYERPGELLEVSAVEYNAIFPLR
jgi:hypothetical protein